MEGKVFSTAGRGKKSAARQGRFEVRRYYPLCSNTGKLPYGLCLGKCKPLFLVALEHLRQSVGLWIAGKVQLVGDEVLELSWDLSLFRMRTQTENKIPIMVCCTSLQKRGILESGSVQYHLQSTFSTSARLLI